MDTHQQVNANDDSCEMTMNQTRNLSVDSLHSRLPQHWTSINGSQVDTDRQTDRHTHSHTQRDRDA